MKPTRALVSAALAAALVAAAPQALAANADLSRQSSQHLGWVGGKSNYDSIVSGLRTGSSVMLTTSANNRTSLAGFTPPARLTDEQIAEALAGARATLSRLGISRPTAEQIQAALIGGELVLANGQSRLVAGSLDAAPSVVATR